MKVKLHEADAYFKQCLLMATLIWSVIIYFVFHLVYHKLFLSVKYMFVVYLVTNVLFT